MTLRAPLPFLLLLVAASVLAQSPADESEAPEALFDQKIGDVGVVLDASGTWTVRLAAGGGLGWGPGGTFPALGYPGFEKGGVFTQEPDFTLTLRLLERYYLSVIYGGTLEDRSFLVGYQGRPGEVVQWVKAGNASFSLPPRAGQTMADGRAGAPAAGAALSLGPVGLELAGRYEDGTRETRSYRGYREASAAQVGLDQWIRGRFFRLPTGPLTGVRVAVQDGEGFREATTSEAAVAPDGTIQLASPATRSFAVTWDGASSVLSPTVVLQIPYETVVPGLSGGPWYRLAGPGYASPFELRNRYPVSPGTVGPIRLVDRSTGLPVEGFAVGQATPLAWFDVSGEAEAPFADTVAGLYPGKAASPPAPATLPWVFQLPGTAPTSYSLGNDVLGASLVVVRNGFPTAAYRFDPGSGELRLDTPVYDTDTVEVSFQRRASGRKASDLALWQAGRWEPAGNQSLEWALQGRWNMEKTAFTTQDLQAPGRAALSLVYAGTAGEWTWRLAGTAGALLTDSTGHRQLYAFGSDGAGVTWNGDSLRPSAAPGSVQTFTLTQANRAPLAYRNYWTNDPLTGTPQVSAWGRPGVGREPGGEGGWTGPYLVRGDGIRDDRLAVLEGDPGNGEWMALQAYFDQGRPRNLGSTTAVSVTFRAPNNLSATSNGRLFLQAGTVSEDWDGSGVVRSREYRTVPTLPFIDRGTRLSFPMPENSAWTNDADGDGQPSPDGSLVTLELTIPTDGGWSTKRFPLSDAERQILTQATGWRLVYVEDGAGGAARTILVGPVVFEGAAWTVRPDASAPSRKVSPVEEADPSGSRRLRVDWSGSAPWTVEGRHQPLTPGAYRTLSFRYQVDDPAASLEVSLLDAQGRGVTVSGLPASSSWARARIDLLEPSLTVEGSPAGSVGLRPGAVAWDRLVISHAAGAAAGSFSIADVEAVDPVWQAIGTTETAATWKQSEPWPSAQFPLVSGMVWSAASVYSGQEGGQWRGQSTVAGTVGPVRTSAEVSALKTAQAASAQGAYEATLPLSFLGVGLEWTDRFSDQGSRAERVVLRLPWLGSWDSQASVQGPPASLDQSYSLGWTADTFGVPGWGLQGVVRWLQSRPQRTVLEGFGPTWVESWTWLRPGEGLAPYHLVSAETTFKGTLAPWSWEWKNRNQASQSRGTDGSWSAWGDWSFRMPLRQEGWSLTPSVGRSAEGVYVGQDEVGPEASAARGSVWLWTGGASLAAPPFAELVSDLWLPTQALRSGKTKSEAGLDWERPAVSDWTDLAVPNSGSLKATSARARDAGADSRTQIVSAQVAARAVNVFGTLGSLPVFDWYRTDVLGWTASAQWSGGTRPQDQTVEGAIAVQPELVLSPEESVRLPASYQGRQGSSPSHSLKLQPGWTLRGTAGLPFELPRWLSPSAFHREWVQDLGAVLQLAWQPDPAPVVRDLLVSWQGRLLLSEKSEFRLTARWGQQWQNDLTVLGLDATLDLILSF